MKFFSKKYEKRNKEKRQKLPKGKKNKGKLMRVLIWVGVFFVACSGIFALIKANTARQTVSRVEGSVQQLEAYKDEQKNKIDYTPVLEKFMTDFIAIYMNVSTDSAKNVDRKEKLSLYSAKGLEMLDVSGDRVLVSSKLYKVEKVDGLPVAQFVVHYKTTAKQKVGEQVTKKDAKGAETKVLEQVDKNVTTEHVALINIPYQEKDGVYKVIENVYFTPVPDLLKSEEEVLVVSNNLEKEKQVSLDKAESVKEFVDEFLKKYAESETKDMEYMMNEPIGLNGLLEYVSSEVKVYESKEGYVVKAIAVFSENGNTFPHKESMTLDLVKKDGKFYVEKLKRTLGGNEE